MKNYRRPDDNRNQYAEIKTYSPQPTRATRKWPPSPTVEDEEASLSREQSPMLPDLVDSRPQAKGVIDQLPILVEIEKEHKNDRQKAKSRAGRYHTSGISSSEDSPGPDTPLDSSASESNDTRYRGQPEKYERSSGASAADITDDRRRPDPDRRAGSERLPDQSRITRNPPPLTTVHRSSSSRDARMTQDSRPLYTSNLNDSRDSPRVSQRSDFTTAQRTLSSSNLTANHRPTQARHASTIGYAGESQGPSFIRDHIYDSPVTAYPRDVPPEFLGPRGRPIVTDSSDSEISPNEMASRTTRHGVTAQQRPRPSAAYPVSQQLSPTNYPNSQNRHSGQDYSGYGGSGSSDGWRSRRKDPISPSSNRSSRTGSPASTRETPPASPRSSGRNFVYPIIKPKASQVPLKPRPSSPARASSYSNQSTTSGLRRASRPSSPTTTYPTRGSPERSSSTRTETQRHRRSSVHSSHNSSRESSPGRVKHTSRSPNPNLRIKVERPAVSQIRIAPNQEMRQRPSGRESTGGGFTSSPILPMSAPNWAPSEYRPQFVPAISTGKVQQVRPQNRMAPCPRPDFTTTYNDWWTIPQIPQLDLCPACKGSLEESGVPCSFVRSQIRPAGTRTRCDMNAPWVRIAFLLILSGRERLDILKDLMNVLDTEAECPGGQVTVRKKWYRVCDRDADKRVSGFSVCSSCVRSIRVLFPNLGGTFESRTSSRSLQPRMCDLTANVPRFAKYIDLLDNISAEGRLRREAPKIRSFIRYAKAFAGVRPCGRDDQYRNTKWYYTPYLPEFTICEECFIEVVLPAQRAGYAVADLIPGKSSLPADPNTKISCQLYSARMRAIFDECCKNQNVASLKLHATSRVMRERELQDHVDAIRDLPNERREMELKQLSEEWERWQ